MPAFHSYDSPYDLDEYPLEPDDQDQAILARALTHFVQAFCPDEKGRTAQSIVLDIIELPHPNMPDEERKEIARLWKMEVVTYDDDAA